MGDGLFDFPDTSFIFVHTGKVIPMQGVDVGSDEEGYPVVTPPVPVTTVCYVASPDPGKTGDTNTTDRIDVVVLVPNSLTMHPGDMFQVDAQPGLQPNHVGKYQINFIRPNPAHTRLLLTRASHPALDYTNQGA